MDDKTAQEMAQLDQQAGVIPPARVHRYSKGHGTPWWAGLPSDVKIAPSFKTRPKGKRLTSMTYNRALRKQERQATKRGRDVIARARRVQKRRSAARQRA